jgi:hypothetical protein
MTGRGCGRRWVWRIASSWPQSIGRHEREKRVLRGYEPARGSTESCVPSSSRRQRAAARSSLVANTRMMAKSASTRSIGIFQSDSIGAGALPVSTPPGGREPFQWSRNRPAGKVMTTLTGTDDRSGEPQRPAPAVLIGYRRTTAAFRLGSSVRAVQARSFRNGLADSVSAAPVLARTICRSPSGCGSGGA